MIEKINAIPFDELLFHTTIKAPVGIAPKQKDNTVFYIVGVVVILSITAYLLYKFEKDNPKQEDHD